MTQRAARSLAATLLLAGLALAGCTSSPSTTEPAPPTQSATTSGLELATANAVFDPSFDVGGTEVCDGVAGRETLEEFDRAPWPELDIAGGVGILTCGNAQGAGWRHIAFGHTDDFGEIADQLGVGWEDVAWWAIDQALEDPDRVELYRDDIANYDVLLQLVDRSSDEVLGEWMVTVGVGLTTSHIITSFPDDTP